MIDGLRVISTIRKAKGKNLLQLYVIETMVWKRGLKSRAPGFDAHAVRGIRIGGISEGSSLTAFLEI